MKSIIKISFLLLALVFFVFSCTTANDPVINNAAKTAGSLSVNVTTSTYKGSYAPKHVLAIWVESTSGTFVKSLVVNAAARKQYLTNWLKSSSSNTTDATVGATLSSHAAKACVWNGTDVSGSVVGDGTYNLRVEFTESDATGKIATFPFNKGTAVDVQTPAATSGVTVSTLTWTPN